MVPLKKKKQIRPNLACGRVPGTVCSACVCVNAGFIASGWAWLHEPMLGHWGTLPGLSDDRSACPGFGVTLESCQVGVAGDQR